MLALKEIQLAVDIDDVRSIVRAQDEWRGRQTINLIASENPQSAAVREVQSSDFMARYAEGHPNQGDQVLRYYQGTKYIDQIKTRARVRSRCVLSGTVGEGGATAA